MSWNGVKKWLLEVPVGSMFSMLLSGLSIGWLVGMSNAPVVESTVGTVLALVVGILSVAAGLKEWPALWADKMPLVAYFSRISLGPMAVFLIGLSGGSAGGLYTRTNKLLGPNAPAIASRWTTSSADSLKIINDMYTLTFSSKGTEVGMDGILHSQKGAPASICEQAGKLAGQALKSFLLENVKTEQDSTTVRKIREDDDAGLEKAKENILCGN